MNTLRLLVLSTLLAAIISGCAHTAALTRSQQRIDVSSHSIGLFTLKISNRNKPDYQPFPFMIFTGDCTFTFDQDGPHKTVTNQSNEYLISIDLKPGINRFEKIWFDYRGTYFGARASIPLNVNADIKPNTVVYLGHIDVVIRPKNNDTEDSAGSQLPLINQATAGFSNGTYDVRITDLFDTDTEWFVSEFPALKSVKVEKSILPERARPIHN
jgi:hypothetical protein